MDVLSLGHVKASLTAAEDVWWSLRLPAPKHAKDFVEVVMDDSRKLCVDATSECHMVRVHQSANHPAQVLSLADDWGLCCDVM